MKQQPKKPNQGQKPVNISISFNINPKNITNQINSVTGWQQPALKGKKIYLENNLQGKNTLAVFNKSKTPQLSYTDRNIYSKEMEYLKPMQQCKKKKHKRKSMDYDYQSYNCHKNNNKLKQTDKSVKIDSKSNSNTAAPVKKQTKTDLVSKGKKLATNSIDNYHHKYVSKIGNQLPFLKSIMMQNQYSDRKVNITSLKSLISKLINKQFSKKSLPILPQTKNKQINTAYKRSNNRTSKRKSKQQKNMNLTHHKDSKESKQSVLENLKSLKSMNVSVLHSEADQTQEIYEKIYNSRYNIKTQQSIDLISEIHLFENIGMKDKEEGLYQSNYENVKQTHKIIETVIAILNENLQLEGQANYYDPNANNFFQLPISNTINVHDQIINTILEYQEQSKQRSSENVNRQEKHQIADILKKRQDMRPFMSSQIPRQHTLAKQLERLKLNQLKKQQVEKWAFLLNYIKDQMNRNVNTQDILDSVYNFLEREKFNYLNQNIVKNQSIKQSSKQNDLVSFTVQLTQKKQEKQSLVSIPKLKQSQKIQLQQQIQSFKQQYSEQNDDWKIMNLQVIDKALKTRYNQLIERKNKQIFKLQQKKILGQITEEQLQKQKLTIQKWIDSETKQINKAKRNIWKGYNDAKGILQKANKSIQSSKKNKSMMKCLSQTYLPKLHNNFKFNQQEEKIIQKQNDNDNDNEYDNDNDNENEYDSEKQMDRIKQRLINMKKQHFEGEYQESDENYDSNQEKQQSSDQQNNKQYHNDKHVIRYEEVEKDFQNSVENEDSIIDQKQSVDISKKLIEVPYLVKDQRLKYLCEEDKQDIFEFIFLDLCIQLFQEPCKDFKIMKSINAHIANAKSMAKKRKGVKTSLNVVKQYLKRFIGFILRTNKDVLKNLNNPMGPTAIQMLKYMHDNDDEIQQQQTVTTLIIPIEIFDQFEKTLIASLEFEKIYDDPERQFNRIDFLKNILHIHNKALFDAMNQFLDQKRPFGIWGKPFPWKKTSTFYHPLTIFQQQEILKQSSDKVAEYCAYVCGLLVDKQDSLVGNAKISEDYLQSIKQDRLSRMLANDGQQRWMFFDDQETQVLVQVSNFIWRSILKEFQSDIYLISSQ